MKYCLDASALVTAWNVHHPMNVLPSLWKELSKNKSNFILIKPIFNEIDPISAELRKKLTLTDRKAKYPLRTWLEEEGFSPIPIEDEDENLALKLRHDYKVNDAAPKGIGTNDTKLIAYAKNKGNIVVTEEGEQGQNPTDKSKYKIPSVCREEDVECIKFVPMLGKLNIKI